MREPQAISWFPLLYQGIDCDSLWIFRHTTGPKPFLPSRADKNVNLYCKGTGQMHPCCSHPQAGHSGQSVTGCAGQHLKRGHGQGSTPQGQSHTMCLHAFRGKPVFGFFLFVLQFLKLVPQFQNQSPVTTMNSKPPPLQEGWAGLYLLWIQTGRPCFQPVPPGKSRVTNRERRGVVYYRGMTVAQGTAPAQKPTPKVT